MDTQLNWLDMPVPEAPPLKRMVHRNAKRTELAAAESIRPGLSKLQAEVLAAFDEFVQLTAEQCERLPAFAHYGPSTIRKRISELAAAGKLVACGEQNNSRGKPMTLYRVAP